MAKPDIEFVSKSRLSFYKEGDIQLLDYALTLAIEHPHVRTFAPKLEELRESIAKAGTIWNKSVRIDIKVDKKKASPVKDYDYYDDNTGLEWKTGPDRDIDWDETKEWVGSLGGDWHMPTTKELKGLYKEGLGRRNMPPLLGTTNWWVWSSEVKDTSPALCFDFCDGVDHLLIRTNSDNIRGFAVRPRKKKDYDCYDPKTDLEWKIGPHMHWSDAAEWACGQGTGWRLPARKELEGIEGEMLKLYDTVTYAWTHEVNRPGCMWVVNPSTGFSYWVECADHIHCRVFAVRKREQKEYDCYDPKTGLEWKMWDDIDTDWYGVKEWVNGLGDEWEMPITQQLNTLYNNRGEFGGIFPGFETGSCIWAYGFKETDKNSKRRFYFRVGTSFFSTNLGDTIGLRGVAVRKRKSVQPKYDYYDGKTKLEWKTELDKDKTWEDTIKWVNSLGDKWRMPTIKELKSLYRKGLNELNMPIGLDRELSKVMDCWVWSRGIDAESTIVPSAWVFNFANGKKFSGIASVPMRTFAVRNRII